MGETKRYICQISWTMLDAGVDETEVMEYLENCYYRPFEDRRPTSLEEAFERIRDRRLES